MTALHKGIWKPGESGNPAGRPKGTRSKFGEDFIRDFANHWSAMGKVKTKGVELLEDLYKENKEAYIRVACAILPRIVEFDDDTKEAITEVLKSRIPFLSIREKIERENATDVDVKH